MATLKLKPRPPGAKPRAEQRPPVRGASSAARKARPTPAQAKAGREPPRQGSAAEPTPQHRRPARRQPPAVHETPVRQHGPPGASPPGRPRPAAGPRPPSRPGWPPEAWHALQDGKSRAAPPAQPAEPARAQAGMRLSKRMSELGIASRREADEWIARGLVRVDGRVVAELGARVLPGQRITLDAKARFQQAQRVTILLHKPIGWVSGQAEDGYEPAIVLVKPQNQWREDSSGIRFLPQHLRQLAPAGRLDIDSTGLLVLTQDGRIARQLIGEDSAVEKEYLVRVEPKAEPLSAEGLALLEHGLELDGEALEPARVEWVNPEQLRFVLREGKKRQIRRMCEAVGLKVTGLKRVRIGTVMLGDLPPGQWRYLRLDERFL